MRTCKNCDQPIVGRDKRAIFCSYRCKELDRAASLRAATAARLAGRICVTCGGPIQSASGKARTCSRECGVALQNAKRRATNLAAWEARKQPCPRCGGELPASRWGAIYCSPECKKREMDARWRKRASTYNRRYLYGLTPEEYAERLAAQDNRCAICGSDTPGGKGGWHVDHDHATKQVRGLLCHRCNIGLGQFADDPARLRAAANYVGAPLE